jgi:hypothetical protein
MMASNFVYAALPEDSIRLLEFSTNVASDMICSMTDFPLDESLDFYALSYTWGSGSASESILCNGLSMKIAPNLNEAIRSLIYPPFNLECPIWVDAICINQHDPDEKSDQVSRMGDIYRQARQVVVWLEPADQDSDIAMDWLERLSASLPSIPHPPMLQDLPELGLPDQQSRLWPALGYLYRRKWFGRLWTFQEAVLALDVKIVCGQKSVGWDTLATVARELNRLRLYPFCIGYQAIESYEDGFRAMENVAFARMALEKYGPLQLPTLLMIADTKLCSDARDRVYAMLGMVSKGFRERILVSYSTEAGHGVVKTYIDCAKACIEESIPIILQLIAGRSRLPGLPSWCPNLDSNQGIVLPFGEYIRAGILGDDTPSIRAKITSESNNLAVTGFRVDTISQVVEGTFHWPHVPNDQQMPRARRFLEWEARCLELAQKTFNSSPDTIPIDHIFTLSANTRVRITKEQDEAFHQAYLDILVNVNRNAQDGGTAHPPISRQTLYNDTWQQIFRHCSGRRYFSTANGRIGLGPPDAKAGDTICVLYGTPPVFVLREADRESKEWILVGDGFVHGLMELSENLLYAKTPDEVFTIV